MAIEEARQIYSQKELRAGGIARLRQRQVSSSQQLQQQSEVQRQGELIRQEEMEQMRAEASAKEDLDAWNLALQYYNNQVAPQTNMGSAGTYLREFYKQENLAKEAMRRAADKYEEVKSIPKDATPITSYEGKNIGYVREGIIYSQEKVPYTPQEYPKIEPSPYIQGRPRLDTTTSNRQETIKQVIIPAKKLDVTNIGVVTQRDIPAQTRDTTKMNVDANVVPKGRTDFFGKLYEKTFPMLSDITTPSKETQGKTIFNTPYLEMQRKRSLVKRYDEIVKAQEGLKELNLRNINNISQEGYWVGSEEDLIKYNAQITKYQEKLNEYQLSGGEITKEGELLEPTLMWGVGSWKSEYPVRGLVSAQEFVKNPLLGYTFVADVASKTGAGFLGTGFERQANKPQFQLLSKITRVEPKVVARKTGEIVGGTAPYFIPYVGTTLFVGSAAGKYSKNVGEEGFFKGTATYVRENPVEAASLVVFGALGTTSVIKAVKKAKLKRLEEIYINPAKGKGRVGLIEKEIGIKSKLYKSEISEPNLIWRRSSNIERESANEALKQVYKGKLSEIDYFPSTSKVGTVSETLIAPKKFLGIPIGKEMLYAQGEIVVAPSGASYQTIDFGKITKTTALTAKGKGIVSLYSNAGKLLLREKITPATLGKGITDIIKSKPVKVEVKSPATGVRVELLSKSGQRLKGTRLEQEGGLEALRGLVERKGEGVIVSYPKQGITIQTTDETLFGDIIRAGSRKGLAKTIEGGKSLTLKVQRGQEIVYGIPKELDISARTKFGESALLKKRISPKLSRVATSSEGQGLLEVWRNPKTFPKLPRGSLETKEWLRQINIAGREEAATKLDVAFKSLKETLFAKTPKVKVGASPKQLATQLIKSNYPATGGTLIENIPSLSPKVYVSPSIVKKVTSLKLPSSAVVTQISIPPTTISKPPLLYVETRAASEIAQAQGLNLQLLQMEKQTPKNPPSEPTQPPRQIPIEIPREIQIETQTQAPRQIEFQVTPQRSLLRQLTTRTITPTYPTSTIKTLPITMGIGEKKVSSKSIIGDMFKVYKRTKGEDVFVSAEPTLMKAGRKLKSELKGGLEASGFVTFRKKKISFGQLASVLGGEFRPAKRDMFRIVQKKERRLGTSSETFGIQRERKTKGGRKKLKFF